MSDEQIVQIIYKLFQSRDFAHIMHLHHKKLGMHLALGEYYEGIVPCMDSIAEIWMGYSKVFPVVESISVPNTSPVAYFTALSDMIDQVTKQDIREDLKNKFAEVLELINSTLYKLSLENEYLEQNT